MTPLLVFSLKDTYFHLESHAVTIENMILFNKVIPQSGGFLIIPEKSWILDF
jgi:hypothetical protein